MLHYCSSLVVTYTAVSIKQKGRFVYLMVAGFLCQKIMPAPCNAFLFYEISYFVAVCYIDQIEKTTF